MLCTMIEIDTRTILLAASSIFAGIGLLLNFNAARRSNRIAVSSKLADLSKLLSDELVARGEMHSLISKELKEAKEYPDKSKAEGKIQQLQELLEKNLKRQKELDSETEYLEEAFVNIDKVNVGGLDAKIAQSYRMQAISKSTLSFAEKKKSQQNA